MRYERLAAVAAIGALAAVWIPADAVAEGSTMTGQTAAAPFDVSDEIRTENGIRYACTGVGKDSRDDPRWDDFSTKLVYSQRGGGYLVDVMTRISRAGGEDVVLTKQCDGPWLLVELDPGEYQVTARAADTSGQVHERKVRISVDETGQTARVINFHDIQG